MTLTAALLRKSGSPESHARIVAAHLVENSRLGIHSHGILRVPQYLKEIRRGEIAEGQRVGCRHPHSRNGFVDARQIDLVNGVGKR